MQERISFVASDDGIATSIHNVIGTDIAPWPVLVTTADNALLTGEILDHFFQAHDGQDVAVAVVERKTMLAAYPDARRTWLKFRGGAYSGANLFALHNDAAKTGGSILVCGREGPQEGMENLRPFRPPATAPGAQPDNRLQRGDGHGWPAHGLAGRTDHIADSRSGDRRGQAG